MKWIIIFFIILLVAVGVFFAINSRKQKVEGGSTSATSQPSVILCNTETPCPPGTVCKFERVCVSKEDPSCNRMVLVCEKP